MKITRYPTGTPDASADTLLAIVDGALVQTPTGWAAKLNTVGRNYSAAAAPTVTDDTSAGYAVWDKWLDTAGGEAYLCLDATEGAAVWELVSLDAADLASLFAGKVDVETGKSLVADTEIAKIHAQNTDTGTSSSTFQIGSGGAKVKNDSGTLKVRNAADDADAPVTASTGTFSESVSAGITNLGTCTVATLPAAESYDNHYITITDGASATDVTVGGGSTQVLARSTGSAWEAVGSPIGSTGADFLVVQVFN